MTIRLDGKTLAKKMQDELVKKVALLKKEKGIVPKLVVILVGDNPASQIYVRNKDKAALKVGFESVTDRLPENTSQAELIQRIRAYNMDPTCHGILVQLPLPKHLDEDTILREIVAEKDVDGFHPHNMGNLLLGKKAPIPCTPYGIMTLLAAYHIQLAGKLAVVVGRSNIVGKPIAQCLLHADSTVVLAHSKTENLSHLLKQADIIIAAVGIPEFIKKEDVKEGVVVVDVGINRLENGEIVGDVASDVAQIASHITPVPGGVGPMTITMLLEQTYEYAVKSINENG